MADKGTQTQRVVSTTDSSAAGRGDSKKGRRSVVLYSDSGQGARGRSRFGRIAMADKRRTVTAGRIDSGCGGSIDLVEQRQVMSLVSRGLQRRKYACTGDQRP